MLTPKKLPQKWENNSKLLLLMLFFVNTHSEQFALYLVIWWPFLSQQSLFWLLNPVIVFSQ